MPNGSPSLAKSILSDALFLKKDVRTQAKEWVEESIEPGAKLALDWSFFMPRLAFSREQLEEKLQLARQDHHFSRAEVRRLEFLLTKRDSSKKGYHLYFLSREREENQFLFGRPTISFNVDELKDKKINYVLITQVQKGYPPAEFYDKLRERAELVKRFSPYRDSTREYPIDSQPLTGGPFLWKELLARERNGQPIEVYRLK